MMWSGNSRDTMLNSVPEKKLRPKPTSEMGSMKWGLTKLTVCNIKRKFQF